MTPPITPPMKAPKIGIGIKIYPIRAPDKEPPTAVPDPIAIFFAYPILDFLFAVLFIVSLSVLNPKPPIINKVPKMGIL